MPDRPLGTGELAYPAVRTRSAWWRWRHARPFWGGLFVTLGGAEILLTVKAPLPVIIHVGMQGVAGYLVPVVLLLCGILLLTNPSQRLFYSIVAALMTLASWVTSNLGGFMLGMLLGLIGSALAFAWSPSKAALHTPAHAGAPADPPPPPGPEPVPAPVLGLADLGLTSSGSAEAAHAWSGPSGADGAAPGATPAEEPAAVEAADQTAAVEAATDHTAADHTAAGETDEEAPGETAGADEQTGAASNRE